MHTALAVFVAGVLISLVLVITVSVRKRRLGMSYIVHEFNNAILLIIFFSGNHDNNSPRDSTRDVELE